MEINTACSVKNTTRRFYARTLMDSSNFIPQISDIYHVGHLLNRESV